MHPASVFENMPIVDPKASQEFFAELRGFPQTYEFVVKNRFDFSAQISVPDTNKQENDVSIILVKEERRGVSEIERTHGKDYAWDSVRDTMLAERFRMGGSIKATLEPGVYRLEVSAPDNQGRYRLVLGVDAPSYSYLDNIQRVAEVKSFLGKTRLGSIFSPVWYVPLLVILGIFFGYRFYKKRYA